MGGCLQCAAKPDAGKVDLSVADPTEVECHVTPEDQVHEPHNKSPPAVSLKTTECEAWSPTAESPTNTTGPVALGVNQILAHLWPRISKYVTDLLTTDVQAQLEEALPKALRGLAFDGERCHLGQRPFEFRRIHIDKVEQSSSVGEMQNLVFQARFAWDADCSVFLTFGGTGFGIKGLSIKGVVIFELVGLIDKPPFFEGVRIFCNNTPEIDIQFQGAAEGLLNWGVVRNTIVQVVTSSLMDLLVVPNRLGFVCDPSTDIFRVKAPPAQGILRLTVWSASSLKAMDTNWFGLGKASSDPYVVVHCGSYQFRSKTIQKSLNPTFDFTVAIPISEASHQRLRIEAFDEDLLSGDDFLGRFEASVEELVQQGPGKKEVRLSSDDKQKGTSGSIRISTEWRPLAIGGVEGTRASSDDVGLVAVGVHSVSRLPQLGEKAEFWVTASCVGSPFLDGFDDKAKETAKLAELPKTDGVEARAAVEENELRSRIRILKKYEMSDDDMAAVLQVDPAVLHVQRSCTAIAHDLASFGTQDIQWEEMFEFPLLHASKAKIKFEVMGKPPKGHVKSFGSYECAVDELLRCEQATSWREVQLESSPVLLKLKLALRRAGAVSIS